MDVGKSGGSAGRHETAVSNSLRMADEAAGRGEYRDAVSWLDTVRATGYVLPEEYERKHAAWSGEVV